MTLLKPASDDLPEIGPVLENQVDRDQFAAAELLIVLSHFDLGVIDAVREHPRGSRRSPKIRLRGERGEFLLKRRAPGRNDPRRVAFAHDVQRHLAERDFPLAALIPTRRSRQTLVRYQEHVYELFEFVRGRHAQATVEHAGEAGRTLGLLHRLLDDHTPRFEPMRGTFHNASGMDETIGRIPDAVAAVDPSVDAGRLSTLCETLLARYQEAGRQVERAGWPKWTPVIIHGDWHPGNLLYRDGKLVAVLDFDSTRQAPRMLDLANAALQFSMRMDAARDADQWPAGLDESRLAAVMRGYDDGSEQPVGADERQALPWLMIEALILESVVPIAATGSFARIPAMQFLTMVEQKVEWIRPRADDLARIAEEQSS